MSEEEINAADLVFSHKDWSKEDLFFLLGATMAALDLAKTLHKFGRKHLEKSNNACTEHGWPVPGIKATVNGQECRWFIADTLDLVCVSTEGTIVHTWRFGCTPGLRCPTVEHTAQVVKLLHDIETLQLLSDMICSEYLVD